MKKLLKVLTLAGVAYVAYKLNEKNKTYKRAQNGMKKAELEKKAERFIEDIATEYFDPLTEELTRQFNRAEQLEEELENVTNELKALTNSYNELDAEYDELEKEYQALSNAYDEQDSHLTNVLRKSIAAHNTDCSFTIKDKNYIDETLVYCSELGAQLPPYVYYQLTESFNVKNYSNEELYNIRKFLYKVYSLHFADEYFLDTKDHRTCSNYVSILKEDVDLTGINTKLLEYLVDDIIVSDHYDISTKVFKA